MPCGLRRLFSDVKLAKVGPGAAGDGWKFRPSMHADKGDGSFPLPGDGAGIVIMGVREGQTKNAGRIWGLQSAGAQTEVVVRRARLPEMFRRLTAETGRGGRSGTAPAAGSGDLRPDDGPAPPGPEAPPARRYGQQAAPGGPGLDAASHAAETAAPPQEPEAPPPIRQEPEAPPPIRQRVRPGEK